MRRVSIGRESGRIMKRMRLPRIVQTSSFTWFPSFFISTALRKAMFIFGSTAAIVPEMRESGRNYEQRHVNDARPHILSLQSTCTLSPMHFMRNL